MSSAAATAGAIKSEPVQYTGPAITIPAPPSAAALTSSAAAAIPSLAAEEEARQRSVRVSQRLRTHAFQSQLLSKHTIHDSHDVLSMKRARIPTKLQLGETVDVIQKSGSSSSSSGSQRGTKRKVLMLLPFRISCSASGKQVGWLTQLNTSNPCMYIHFPLGNMKLFGTVIPTTTSFLSIQYSTTVKKSAKASQFHQPPPPLQVKATFEQICVFSQWRWIGHHKDNPEEKELPLPSEIHIQPRRPAATTLGGSMPQSSGSGSQQEGTADAPAAAASTAMHIDDADEEGVIDLAGDEDEAEEDANEDGAPAAAHTPAKRKRPEQIIGESESESEADDADAGEGDEEEQSGDEAPAKKRRKSTAPKRADEWHSSAESSSDDDAAPSSVPVSQSSVSRPRRSAAAKPINYAVDVEKDESEEDESEHSDEDDD